MTTINGLHGKPVGTQLAQNVLLCLTYIADNLVTARVIDPANSNNIVSDDLTDAEKRAIAAKARESLGTKDWREIIR